MIQHGIAILLVVVCLAYIAKQIIGTFRGGKGRVGSCCAKGCSATEPTAAPKAQFLPADLLLRKR